jgi:hypothetical protein
MKKIFTLILLAAVLGLKAQIYVNSAATGTGNGSSWANAYTDLQAALNDTTNANIWIAKGTYKPAGPAGDTTVFYRMTRVKNIFGGFAGTETSLAQRNPTTNVVILSGDVNGDDKADSVYVNKRDNRRHVLVVEPTVTGVASFDGITVSGGSSRDTSRTRASARETHGAGILSYASLNINNCRFTGNRGLVGSALATLDVDSIQNNNVTITKSLFSKNGVIVSTAADQPTTFGMAAYVWKVNSLKVDSCSFTENVGVRGALCIDSVLTSVITNTSFSKNIHTGTVAGGGYYSLRTKSSTVRNCEFVENSGTAAGTGYGMFFEVTANTTIPSLNYSADTTLVNIIEKCLFKGNKAPLGSATALRLQGGSNVVVRDNIFEDNTSVGSAVTIAGAGHILAREKNVILTNNIFRRNTVTTGTGNVAALGVSTASAIVEKCKFEGNTGGRGGAIVYSGTTVNSRPERFVINDTDFDNNNGTVIGGAVHNAALYSNGTLFINNTRFTNNKCNRGGALYVAFKSTTFVNNCIFELNSAAELGGAIGIQNDTTSLFVRNSSFLVNKAANLGGVIFGFAGAATNNAGEYKISFVNCKFEGNQAATGSGGVFHIQGLRNATSKFGDIFIDRCDFVNNEGATQAGAINLSNKGIKIQNSIFSGNTATGTGIGGAISYNSTDSLNDRPMTLINNTFEGNVGALISGVAVWVDTSRFTRSLVNFQNNLFVEEKGIFIEENKPTIVSLGGNLFINEASKIHTGAKDFVETGFSFLDQTLYTVKPTSKAVNGGVAAGAPAYDYNGKVRVGIPDIGAVETGATVTKINEKLLTEVSIFPNPTAEKLAILDDKSVKSGDRYVIFDIAGKIVQRGSINDSKTLDVSTISGGEHFLRIYSEKILQAKFLVVR